MVIGRQIGPELSAVQKHKEITIIDAVRVLIEKHKGLVGRRPHDLRIFTACFRLFMQAMPWALVLDLDKAGSRNEAKLAMMAITTSNSNRSIFPFAPAELVSVR